MIHTGFTIIYCLIWDQVPGQQGKEGRWYRGLKKPGRGRHRHTGLHTETGDFAEWEEHLFPKSI